MTSVAPKGKRGRNSGSDGAKAKSEASRPAQSAAAPSPFPPIANYAFLSNCHTSALVASAVLSWGLISVIALIERGVNRSMGAR